MLCAGTLIGSGLNLLVNEFGTSAGCPPAYPYRIAGKGSNAQYHLCYKDSKSASAGSGPCGSWCASHTLVGADLMHRSMSPT